MSVSISEVIVLRNYYTFFRNTLKFRRLQLEKKIGIDARIMHHFVKKVSLCDVNQLLIQVGILCYLICTLRLHAYTSRSTRITTPRNLISNNNII